MNLSVTMVTLSTMKIPPSDLSFLSFLSSQGSCFAVVADLYDYFAEVEKIPDFKQKSKFGRIYGRIEILFLEAVLWATFPGLVRGKQSARLSTEHIKPSKARTHFNTEVHKNRKSKTKSNIEYQIN